MVAQKKQKSMVKNAFFSSMKTLTTIIFPLITYPYITRVLSVENIGKVNFGQSIIGYFSLLAALGISTFAVRNGSRIKDDSREFGDFANKIFTINVISTILSCAFLFLLVMLPTKLSSYRVIILLQGITVALSPLAVDWIYIINEDFGYITIRSFGVHLLSLLFMLLFVKKEEDVYLYVALTTISMSFGNLFNFFHSKKYVKLKLVKNTNWKVYRKSISLFFVNSIATTIYLNSDITLLGLMCSDREVGLYSVATKIYSIIKQMFNAVVASTIPRLAYLKEKDSEAFTLLMRNILSVAIFFIVPASAGIVLLRHEIILLISGDKYIEASSTLAILALAIFFAVLANIFANGLLICAGRERYVMRATIASATANAALNFIFIPWISHNGAALTTLIAEIIVVSVSMYYGKDYLKKILDVRGFGKALLGSAAMCIVVNAIWSRLISPQPILLRILITILVSVLVYGMAMAIMQDRTFKVLLKSFASILKRKNKKDRYE